MKRLVLTLCFLFLTSACQTNKQKRFAATGFGVGVGAIIGASTAPSSERPELHALYWGGILGLVAGVASNFYYSDERDLDVLRLENEKLKAQLDFFQNGPATLLKEKVGPADKKYFQSGKAKIKLYKIDQWVEDGPNKRYHRDQLMEIVPLDQEGL